MATIADVRAIPYFVSLSDTEAERLAQGLIVRRYDARGAVVAEGEASPGFYLVRRGRARLYRSGRDGREQTMRILMPGDTFGEVPIFDDGTIPASVEALEPSEIVLIPADLFRGAVRDHPEVAAGLLRHFASRMRFFTELVHQISLQTVQSRLARYLFQLAVEEGVQRSDGIIVHRELTMQDLASLLGSVREVVSRTLHAMEEEGIVTIRRDEVVIRDLAALRDLL